MMNQHQTQPQINEPSTTFPHNPTTQIGPTVPHAPPQHPQMMYQQQQHDVQQVLIPSQVNYVVHPPDVNTIRLIRPLPPYIPSRQIQRIIESTPVGEEFSDSIRMLVLLENNEQRLITFTLPRESCPIHEILEQTNVPFQSNMNIRVMETNSNGINYIVTVGNVFTTPGAICA